MPEDVKPAAEAVVATPAAATQPDQLQAYMASRGYSPERVLQAVYQAEALATPEGAAHIVDTVKKSRGAEIAKEYALGQTEDFISKLNAADRRKLRRAVARAGDEDDIQDTDPAPDRTAEVNAAVQAARAEAAEAKSIANTTAEGVALSGKLVAFMSRSREAAAHPEEWQAEVVPLLRSGHPRYQGPDGVQHAHDDVVGQWRKKGEMAGLKPEAAPTPRAGASVVTHTDADISKRIEAVRGANRKDALLREATAIAEELGI